MFPEHHRHLAAENCDMYDKYELKDYVEMILDQPRTQAYVSALERAVRPGSVVVDIGTGIGIFALLSCRFGARKVYAIEPNDAIHTARRIAADNGFADRIEFIQDVSTRITLSERADVVVSDLRGMLPLFSHHIDSIIHARPEGPAPAADTPPGGTAALCATRIGIATNASRCRYLRP